ncbi:O-antigen ligase family protein [Paraburkholderia terrae]|nr:O-antigen ligase family protein [Paraburkholderia terrae]
MALLFPLLCLFTPKGFGLLDLPSVPYLSLNRAIVVIMVAFFLIRVMSNGFRITNTNFPLTRPFVLLAGAYSTSCIFNPATWSSDAVTAVMNFSELVFPCYFIWYFCKSTDEAKRVLKWFYVIGLIVSLYGTAAYLLHFNPYFDYLKQTTPSGRVTATDYEDSLRGLRAVGTLSHPITYGAFQTFTVLVGIFLMRKNRSAAKLLIFLGAQTALLVGIAVTNSRTPLVYVILALVIFTCFTGLRDKVIVIKVIVVALVVGSLFGMDHVERLADFISSVASSSRGDTQNGSSLQMRAGQLLVAWRFFSESPIFGGGVSATRTIIASGTYPDFYNAESAIFQWAIDLGLLGLVAYFALFAQLFRLCARVKIRFFRAVLYAMIAGYVVFIFATGVLETMQLFLVIVTLFLIAGGKEHPEHDRRPRRRTYARSHAAPSGT